MLVFFLQVCTRPRLQANFLSPYQPRYEQKPVDFLVSCAAEDFKELVQQKVNSKNYTSVKNTDSGYGLLQNLRYLSILKCFE